MGALGKSASDVVNTIFDALDEAAIREISELTFRLPDGSKVMKSFQKERTFQ